MTQGGDAAPGAGFDAAFPQGLPARLGVAVSGGSDSLALLHLAAGRARGAGTGLVAVTVDHGLRAEAADEAAFVAGVCAGLGVPHRTLTWGGWDGRGNLQAAARRARHALIGEWAQAQGIGAVALGHTLDDQAETVLMRLARGSGVDGLSGMAGTFRAAGIRWVRPLLGQRREALRDYLRGIGQRWVEDPSNADQAFERARMRKAMPQLAALGITAEGLSETAARLRLARRALERLARTAAERVARIDRGDVLLDREGLLDCPRETQLRLVAHALSWVASAEYRPRLAALSESCAAALGGVARPLHGALLVPEGGTLRITREYQAVRAARAPADALWDGRWRLDGPGGTGLELRALGEAGLAECPGWRATGLPRASLIASPAVWRGDILVAAPLAGLENGWRAEVAGGAEGFFAALETD